MPSLSPRPLYREIFHDAWTMVWHRRSVWIVALGAGILQTGGIIDVLSRLLRNRLTFLTGAEVGSLAQAWQSTHSLLGLGTTTFAKVLIGLKLGQAGLLGLLFAVTVVCFALLCQGALVYLIGARGRFSKPTLSEAFAIARERIWGVAILNLLPVGAYLFTWFILLSPFERFIPLQSAGALIAYVGAIIVCLIVGFIGMSVHLLALPAIILEGIHTEAAIKEAWAFIRSSWFTILETALLLFFIGLAIFFVSLVAFIVAVLPFLAFVGVAIVLQAPGVADMLLLLCEALFILVMLAAGGFTIAFQYATWNRLYARMKRGMAVAKVVRVVHGILDKLVT